MLSEVKKSVNSIINERVTSPFWGAIILAWFIWNWRIIVLLLFVSEENLPLKDNAGIKYNKVEYILSNYSDKLHLLWGPLLSLILIIAVLPFLSNASYWLYLRFRKWKIEKRNEIEDKQVLTIAQSLELRKEIKAQEKSFQNLIEEKDSLIAGHEKLLSNYKNKLDEVTKTNSQLTELNQSFEDRLRKYEDEAIEMKRRSEDVQAYNTKLSGEARSAQQELKDSQVNLSIVTENNKALNELIVEKDKQIQDLRNGLNMLQKFKEMKKSEDDNQFILDFVINNKELNSTFSSILFNIQKNDGRFGGNTPSNHIAYFEGHEIIQQEGGKYSFTRKGKEFLRLYSSQTLKSN